MVATKASKRRALNTLLNAAENYAFRGAGHPEDQPAIEYQYLRAINAIERLLDIKETAELEDLD